MVIFAFANDNLKTVTRNYNCDREKVCATPICALHPVNVLLVFKTLILHPSNGRFLRVFPRYTVCKAGLQVTGPTRGVETQIRRKPKTPFDTCNFAFDDSNLKPFIS